MVFGDEVRRRREALRMTLEQLAERAGLSPNYIGSVENGLRDPSLSTILALARGLRVAPGELLGPMKELTPAAFELARAFDSAAPEVQDLAVRLLRLTVRRKR